MAQVTDLEQYLIFGLQEHIDQADSTYLRVISFFVWPWPLWIRGTLALSGQWRGREKNVFNLLVTLTVGVEDEGWRLALTRARGAYGTGWGVS